MAKQYQVITLGLPFMSQPVSIRNAFYSKMLFVRKDKEWIYTKRSRPMMLEVPGLLLRGKNLKNLCHHCTFGAKTNWQKELEGILIA